MQKQNKIEATHKNKAWKTKTKHRETQKAESRRNLQICSVVECQTHAWMVMSLSPCRSGRRILFSRVNFLYRLLVHAPPLCYQSSTENILVIVLKVQVAGYS